MDFTTSIITYDKTRHFSKIITDYVSNADLLKPFFAFEVNEEGVKKAIEERKKHPVDRQLLTEFLRGQYANLPVNETVNSNIDLLAKENTYSVVTAHQPNIFTGHLYFLYKILHVVRLANEFNARFPDSKFVPVFYMGSEDADLEELGHIFLNGEKLNWETNQKGAVGRMRTTGLADLINRIEGELQVFPHGQELISLVRAAYADGQTIQQATLSIVHALFGDFGVVTIIPDDASLKRTMIPVFEDDLMNQRPSAIVEQSIEKIGESFKVQAKPREINLFYLKDDIRERIVRTGDIFRVAGTELAFSKEEIIDELHTHPERFSPNVILRGMYQEMILPDIAFVGGGGETAYWLELKELFQHYNVFYPMLVLRNSFLFIDERRAKIMTSLDLEISELFQTHDELVKKVVSARTKNVLDIEPSTETITKSFDELKLQAGAVDITLEKHVDRLKAGALHKLESLRRKMMRAEKRRFTDESRQLEQLKERLFPQNGLQERVENILPYYAKYGKAFLQMLYDQSLTLEQQFVVITETKTD